MIEGTIYRVERFALHDGPGIRTVVFLKGCPLTCVWCSSPESQKPSAEIACRRSRCVACHRCVAACSRGALSVDAGGFVTTDRARCIACGACALVCPSGARTLVGRSISVAELVAEIEKDRVFYRNSGGGVTLSGGEPTAQPEFSSAVLEACRDLGIHTAIETCADADWQVFESVVRHADLLYLDLKAMAAPTHARLTGASNDRILDNLRRAVGEFGDLEVVVRVPVVPGCNDSREDLEAMAEHVAGLGGVRAVELLAYHRLGLHTYDALERDYGLTNVEPPTDERMETLAATFAARGLVTRIGG